LPSDHKAQHVQHILSYDEDTAGGLMTTEYVKAEPTETVGMVMEKIKHVSEQFRSIHFVYVVDQDNYLLGVASLRKLIVAEPDVLMNDLIAKKDKTLTIGVDRSVSSVGRQMTKYNLYAIAVVGHDGKLLGVVTSDDIMRRLFPKA
jgi:magnesium transporter